MSRRCWRPCGRGQAVAEGLRVNGLDPEARRQPAAAYFEAFPWEGVPPSTPETMAAGAFLEGL